MREYAKCGPVKLKVAESLDEALEFLSRLRELHQNYWRARGWPGAFASRFANEFHASLIRTCFPLGEIQILEVSAGSKRFGYLYNFVRNGVVSNYQSGFLYGEHPKRKPGLLTHMLAIEHNLQRGMRVYDFLMGEQQYKRSLATDEERMIWLVLQRSRLRFRVEVWLRALRQYLPA
jgi:CelD/BcsL family acetyltransferase involved in cellulose biosynthesis